MPTETTISNPSEEGEDWELRKLKAEALKAEREENHFSLVQGFQLLSTFASLGAVVIALATLKSTTDSQRTQRAQEAFFKEAERYEANVKMLGEANSSLAKLAAVENISVFWNNPRYKSRVASLLITSANEVDDAGVRAAIRALVLAHSDTTTLRILTHSNRHIQVRIRELDLSPDGILPWQAVYRP
ncbi:MAG TPA: hypothetical protein VFQ45_09980, partial [Longimicrobium sp.]|nr:hypothetical protein [Longimicrobium sp.]